MVLNPKKDDHVTLICSFKIQSGRREELIALLERDHTFLREFPGFVSVAFHKATTSEHVAIELLQFQSALKLRAVSHTPRGAAHLDAVSRLAKLSPNIYRISCGFARSV